MTFIRIDELSCDELTKINHEQKCIILGLKKKVEGLEQELDELVDTINQFILHINDELSGFEK